MSEAPYMQLYVGDYMADTRHLTTEQHGAYLLLLMAMWTAGGKLPNEPMRLARIAGVDPRRWHKVAPEVMEFFDVADAFVTQKRLLQEREKARLKSKVRSEAGRIGGNAKALKENKQRIANATILPEQSATILHILSPEDDDERSSSSTWGREEFSQLEATLREAAGLQSDPDPTLADISAFMPLIDAGVNIERVIVPKVRLIAGKWRHRPGKPWAYLADAVANSIAEERERSERIDGKLNTTARKELRNESLRILAE